MLENRTYGTAADDNDTDETLVRYIYSNHLQSAALELDGAGNIISYEEYHPYGTTAYQAVNAGIKATAKRYRYTGKERDEESGLYYHGARYYIPWLCRWTAVDPMEAKFAGLSPYNYAFNNPVMFNDPSGMEGEGFKQSNPIELEKVTVIGRHPVHDKIESLQSEITDHLINAGINLATTKTQFSPTATVLAILMPSPGENAAADYLQGVKSRASEYADILSALAGLADKIIEASGAEISPAKPPQHSNLDPVGQAMQFYAQLQIANALAKNIEDFTADVKAASYGDNKAKGKLGFDVLIILLTEAVGAYARATKAIKLGEEVRAPQGFKSLYPEKWQRSTFSTSQGSETLDMPLRIKEQPLQVKSKINTAQRIGADYENFLVDKLGGTGGFKTGGVQFDGAYNNIWYEAKAGGFWENVALKDPAKWRSKFGNYQRIAKDNGKIFHVYSQNTIPQIFKDFFNRKGIPYRENLKH